MKKAVALITAIMMVVFAVAPLNCKASADEGLYYITYQANIANQPLVDAGYNSTMTIGYSAARYMTNSQIDFCNNLQLPVDLGDWNYYILMGSNTWQGENNSGSVAPTLFVYNSDSPLILYKGNQRLRELYGDKTGYTTGEYGWDRGGLNVYAPNLDELKNSGQIKKFRLTGETWSEDVIQPYDGVSVSVGGQYICSTNTPYFFYGKDICMNSTKTVTNIYDNQEVFAWFQDGVINSESYMEYFKVTKDGNNVEDWNNIFGPENMDFDIDQGIGFAQFQCITLFDGSSKPTLGVKSSYSLSANGSLDVSDPNVRAYEYGIKYDIVVNYKIQASSNPKIFQPILGETWSGSIFSSFTLKGKTYSEMANGTDFITFDDIYNADGSIVTGVSEGSELLNMMNYILNNKSKSVFNIPSVVGVDILEEYNEAGNIGILPLRNYGLSQLTFQITATPLVISTQKEGVVSSDTVDYLSGAHGGVTTDIVKPDGSTVPGTTTPNQNQFLTPQYDQNGNLIYVVVNGDPSSGGQANNGIHGSGNSYVNITLDGGVKELLTRLDTWHADNWNKSWWSVFGTFTENPASALYREYFGWLPEEFISFFTKIVAVVCVIGAAKFIRRV